MRRNGASGTAILLACMVGAGCARPIVQTAPLGVLVITVTDRIGERTIRQQSRSSPPFRIASRPTLPRILLPYEGEGLLYAGGSGNLGPVLFALEEDPFMGTGYITAIDISLPILDEPAMRESLARYNPVERPPCVAVSGFFIKGIGGQPTEPILLSTRRGPNWGTTVVDPAKHTLDLRPIARLPPHPVSPPVEVFVSVSWASSEADFLILAVTATPEGYRASSFRSSMNRSGWNSVPGDGETRFYVLDDGEALRSPCRKRPSAVVGTELPN